jgi:3-hydroxyisobutyrate dehydrogenase
MTDFGLERCVDELEAIEESAQWAAVPHPTTSSVVSVHRSALEEFGAVDGELMAAAWLGRHAGLRLHAGVTRATRAGHGQRVAVNRASA